MHTNETTRLDTNGAANYLSLSPGTLRWYRHAGIGPRSYKLGRRLFFDVSDLDAWIEGQKAATTVGGTQ